MKNIKHIGIKNVLIYFYHSLLIKFLKQAKFDPSINILDIYCQLNPGYNILSGSTNEEKGVMTRLHSRQLNNFWRFTCINRVCEVLQFYVDNNFIFPKNDLKYLKEDNPFILKDIDINQAKVNYLPLITQENYKVIESFVDFLERNQFQSDNQMGELFDNRIFDMYSSFDIMVDSATYSHYQNSLVEIRRSDYNYMLKWLIAHIDDVNTIHTRDSSRFFQVLKVFVFLHHIESLIGIDYKNDTKYNQDERIKHEIHMLLRDPLYLLKSPKSVTSKKNFYSIDGFDAFNEYDMRKIYQEMSYYGHLTYAECLCSKINVYPSKDDHRTNTKEIVDFMSIQHYLYLEQPRYDTCTEREA